MPTRTYLAAIDLSPPSRSALAAAVALARGSGATVELFCTVPSAIVDDGQLMVENVRDSLAQLAQSTTAGGVPARVEVRVEADVPRAIAARAAEIGADLVAVGPSGVSGWRKFVLGSVTERLLRLCPVPLLVVRRPLAEPPARILAAIDRAGGSVHVLRAAVDLARTAGAKVTALHVIAAPGAALLAADDVILPATWALESERVANARREFVHWIEAAPHEGVDVEARTIEGNAAERVLEAARAEDVAIVVVGSHGHSAVHDLFVGSVARTVATHAAASVLVVRARSARDAGVGLQENQDSAHRARAEV